MSSKVALLALLVLTTLACSNQAPEIPGAAGVDTNLEEHPADGLAAARYLPHGTPALLYTDNLGELLVEAGRGEAMARFRQLYEGLAFSLVRDVGYNVLSPEALADLGIDVEGQTAVALVAERSPAPAVVVFVTLSHPERFKNLAFMIANGHIGKKRMGLFVGEDGVMVGRRDVAMAVMGHLGMVVLGTDANRIGRALLTLQPEESLQQHRPFRVALRAAPEHHDLLAYVDARAAVYHQAGVDPRWMGTSTSAALADIDRMHRAVLHGARSRHVDAAALVALDERYQREREALRDGAFAERLRTLFGGMGGAALGLDFTPSGVDVSGHLDLDAKSIFAKLLRARAGRPPLARALDAVPGAMVGVSVDWSAAVALARALEAPLVEANVLIGADLEDDLLPLLTGDVTLSASPPAAGWGAVHGLADLSLALLIGVTNPQRVDEILTGFGDREGTESMLQPLGPRRWKMKVPETGPLFASLTGNQLVVASDAALAERLTKKRKVVSGPVAWQLATGAGQGLLAFVTAPALLATNLPLFAAPPAVQLTRLPWHDPNAIQSPEYVAKLAEINALEAQVAAVTTRRHERQRAASLAAAEPLGAAAITLRPSPHGVAFAASYRTGGATVAKAVADWMKGRDEQALREEDAELDALAKRRATLETELDAIYERTQPKGDPPKSDLPKPTPPTQTTPAG